MVTIRIHKEGVWALSVIFFFIYARIIILILAKTNRLSFRQQKTFPMLYLEEEIAEFTKPI